MIQAHPVAMLCRSGRRTLFRSKLEARWSIFFDQLGFEWRYEPKQSPGVYTPDVSVDGIGLVEIKPAFEFLSESLARIGRYIEATGDRIHLLYGSMPHDSDACIVHGNPPQVFHLTRLQRNVLLGGTQRQKAAVMNYEALRDSIEAALKAASSRRIPFDPMSAMDRMRLADSRR
jgi:hypothetical protein